MVSRKLFAIVFVLFNLHSHFLRQVFPFKIKQMCLKPTFVSRMVLITANHCHLPPPPFSAPTVSLLISRTSPILVIDNLLILISVAHMLVVWDYPLKAWAIY